MSKAATAKRSELFSNTTLTCTSVASNPAVSNLLEAHMCRFGRTSTHFHQRLQNRGHGAFFKIEIHSYPERDRTFRGSFLSTGHSERMLPVKLLELPIDLWQMLAQGCRRFEKLLTGNRKELGWAFKGIRVNRQVGPVALLILQAIPCA